MLYRGRLAAHSARVARVGGFVPARAFSVTKYVAKDKPDKPDKPEKPGKDGEEPPSEKPAGSSAAEKGAAKAADKGDKANKAKSLNEALEKVAEDSAPARGVPRLKNGAVAFNPKKPGGFGAAKPGAGIDSGVGAWEPNDTGEPITKNDKVLPIQLQYRPVLPGMASHFTSRDPKLINAVSKLQESRQWDSRVVAVMSKKQIPTTQLVTNMDDIYDVACCCRLQTIVMAHNSENQLTLYGTLFPLFRVRVGELVENVKGGAAITSDKATAAGTKPASSPLDELTVQLMKGVSALPNEPYAISDEEIQQLCRKIIDGLNQMSSMSSSVKAEVEKFSQLISTDPGSDFTQPDFLADFAASLIPKNEGLQEILEITNIKERVRRVADLVGKEVTYMRVQEGIYKYGHDQTQQRNREMILHEYLRYIKKELGMEGDDKTKLADRFQERADSVEMPKDVRHVFEEEINKFRSLEPTAGEYNTVRTYLDWLTQLPWGKYSTDKFVIRKAMEILDKSHYGLKDVKDRILEFLAVGKLSGSVDGKIICLAGPPGVGKTSIAKSIAEALDRKFDRFSVGGLYDASEIKGHRRTYVASLPGRIVQALKRCQTLNPVILIDEIDKLGRGSSHGDPSAALLEVLDPEQNKNFQDTYLEVPIDLSRVLFVCTANNLEGIPAPLMDRMEVINIPGYLPEEKVSIAESYLSPNARKTSGLEHADITITPDALQRLVSKYTRESGVRGLNKTLEKIYRKLAFHFVRDLEAKDDAAEVTADVAPVAAVEGGKAEEAAPAPAGPAAQIPEELVRGLKLAVGPSDLVKYIGVPLHARDRLFEQLPPGVSMGLGWTPAGGVPLFIESVIQESLSLKSTPRLTRTGQIGEVMNESTSIAYSFARMYMTKHFPRNRFLDFAVVHTHFPEGAIKKDGPSAGIAMATSLISLAMNLPVNNDVAMTGELTLTGKVLQIGGLREKAVAAKTLGAKTIVFPEDNRAEWEDLPDKVKEGIDARPVREFQEVFDLAFGAVDPARVNAAWPELAKEAKEPAEPSERPNHIATP